MGVGTSAWLARLVWGMELMGHARRTAKVWKDFQLAYTLEGHEQAVWAVLALEGEDDLVLTGALAPRRFSKTES